MTEDGGVLVVANKQDGRPSRHRKWSDFRLQLYATSPCSINVRIYVRSTQSVQHFSLHFKEWMLPALSCLLLEGTGLHHKLSGST